jgi:hypothetical protein
MNNLKTANFDIFVYLVFLSDLFSYFFEPSLVSKWIPFVSGSVIVFYMASCSIRFIYVCLSLTTVFIACKIFNQDSSLNLATVLINLSLGCYIFLRGLNVRYVFLFMMIIFLSLGFRSYTSGGDPFNVLSSGSNNYISVIVLSMVLLYYAMAYKFEKLVSFMPAFIALVFSVWAGGRSGIISSVLLLLGLFFYNLFCIKKKGSLSLYYAISILVVVALLLENFVVFYDVEDPNSFLWRFTMDMSSDGRLQIFKSYIQDMTVLQAIFGRGSDFIQNKLGMSVHISYIQWHVSFGLFAFFLYVLVFWAYLKMFFINKLYTVLMTVLLVRGSSDHILLTGGFCFGILLVFFCLKSFAPKYEHSRLNGKYMSEF